MVLSKLMSPVVSPVEMEAEPVVRATALEKEMSAPAP
jgi:hypothetical protein